MNCRAKLIIALAALFLPGGCSQNASSPGASLAGNWVETELFFGLTENGVRILDEQWHDFVDKSITPRFPDGFTLEYGEGQYRGDDKQIHKEPTAILVLLYPKDDFSKDDAILNALEHDYDVRFHQESVLRSDWDARARFVSANPTGH